MGLAISTDGINWTKYDDSTTTNPPFQFSDPVLPLGSPGSWEAIWAWSPSVLTTPAGYEMLYEGINMPTGNGAVGYATSKDGINWIKDSNNPILTGVSGSWASAIGATSVIKDGDLYRMWMSGLPDFFPYPGRIGYAIAPVITGLDEKPQIANEFSLHQNYPNPFNPSTKIKYSIINKAIVIIKVYDILGNEIKTLVNEEKTIGNYEIEFDGSNLASGIYLYRMQAGNFSDTKKLILIK